MRRLSPFFFLVLPFVVGACDCGGTPSAPQYQVSGTVSGLEGTGLTLSLNGTALEISQSGAFTFPATLAEGTELDVKVAQQPTSPWQTCAVAAPIGPIAQDVTDVAVTCTTNEYTVGGTVVGLQGAGLVLHSETGDDLDVAADGAFTFATPIKSGKPFSVTVTKQPELPSQTCEVMGASGVVGGAAVTTVVVNCTTDLFTVGGTVSGLAGTGLTLQNAGETIDVSANGSFAFPTPLPSGSAFDVAVISQPANPTQACTVTMGEGQVVASHVMSVVVTCVTSTFPVGGVVSGLEGTGLVLQSAAGEELAIAADGSFTFPTEIESGTPYAVTVSKEPTSPWQTCAVANGSGMVGSAAIVDVAVTCTTRTYPVGGTVSGLLGGGLVLENNGGDALAVTMDGTFVFASPIPSGQQFDVTVATQPTAPHQTCVVSGGQGEVAGGAISSVTVNCSTNEYSVGGTVSGLSGSGLEVSLNGGAALALNANGGFAFPDTIPSGEGFTVTIVNQPGTPWQTCSISNGTGTIGGADETGVTITCVTNTYSVSGTVNGLAGSGLVLLNNAGDALNVASDGTFIFNAPVQSGDGYLVTVGTQPTSPWQTCTVAQGSGVITNGAVTDVTVTCVTQQYSVGGSVSGLSGGTVALTLNGGNNLTLNANGTFVFSQPVPSGTTYTVSVAMQPTTPAQTCTVAQGNGTITNAAVSNVAVTCVTNTYAVGGAVSGLSGSGLVLRLNGGNNLSITGNGSFSFPVPVASGASYAVTIFTNPTSPSQFCTVTNGTGTVGASAVTNVVVNCATTGCSTMATFSAQIAPDLWICSFNASSGKTWPQTYGVCNEAAGFYLPTVGPMTRRGLPSSTQITAAMNLAKAQGHDYVTTGHPARSCTWNSASPSYQTCNGLGYVHTNENATGSNWLALTDGNTNDLRSWPSANTTGAHPLASLCLNASADPLSYVFDHRWR